MATVPYGRRRATEIAADLIARFVGQSAQMVGRITDLNAGSNLRSLLEAVAIVCEQLDAHVAAWVRRAIPEMLYAFMGPTEAGFPAIPAQPARGIARFERGTVTTDVAIPLGTRVGGVGDTIYRTTVADVLLAGDAVIDVPIEATVTGTAGDAVAQTLRLLDVVPGIARATNPTALRGTPAESEDARRQRFVGYLRGLARSVFGGIEAGAQTAAVGTERVLAVRAGNRPEQRGLVDVIIDNGGGTASAALVTATQNILDGGVTPAGRVIGYKALGVVVEVAAVRVQPVAITAELTIETGYRFAEVQTAVAAALTVHLFGLGMATDAVLADLICVVAEIPGVRDVRVLAPTENVPAARDGRLLPGVITLTEAPA